MIKRCACVLLVFLLSTGSLVMANVGRQPAELIEQFNTVLIDVMEHADELGYQGRFKKLEPVVRDSYDFKSIGRIVTGRYWNSWSVAQQQEFIDTFSELSTATYAYQFDGYNGESFELHSVTETAPEQAVVRVIMHKANGDTVQFDYMVRETADRWKIVNVTANGVSDLALKRAEFAKILKQEDYQALIDLLKGKIASYSEPANTK